VGLPIALLGQGGVQAPCPRLAACAAEGDYRRLRGTMLKALGAMAGLSVLAIAGMLLLGRPTIRVLFEHGDFTAADGDLTAKVLTVYALGLPAYVATEVLVRSLIAMRDPRTQLFTNTLQLLLRAALVALLLGAFQARAIPFAFAVSASLETCALLAIALGRLRRLERRALAPSAA
jgi:putative peptidoglycan lipid II flippase